MANFIVPHLYNHFLLCSCSNGKPGPKVFTPQTYVAQKLEESKLQRKKEKLNNIAVMQKKVLVSSLAGAPAGRRTKKGD